MKAKPIVVKVVVEVGTLNLEDTLARYTDLYQKRGVKLSPTFATGLRQVWEARRLEIQQTAQNLRYDAVAVVPGGLKLPEFHQQMTRGYDPTWESDNFKEGGSWAGIKSFGVGADRIVLFHNCLNLGDHSLIQPLLGQNLFQVSGLSETELDKRITNHQPFTGKLTVDGQQQTFDGLTVEDYLAIQADIANRTKQHLDGGWFWSWLIRSRCGRRVPGLRWRADRLHADADEPAHQNGHLAPRPAAVFI